MTFPEHKTIPSDRQTITASESYVGYHSKVLNLPDRSPKLPHAYEVLRGLRKRAALAKSLKNTFVHEESKSPILSKSILMKNVDCIIVYVKVGNKLVPEIFDTVEDAQRYMESVERNEA